MAITKTSELTDNVAKSTDGMKHFSLGSYLKAAHQLGLNTRVAAILLLIEIGAVLFEFGGVAMLVPVFQFMQEGGALEKLGDKHGYWQSIIAAHEVIGLSVSLFSLLAISFVLILLRQIIVYVRVIYRVTVRQALNHRLRQQAFRDYLAADFAFQQDVQQGEFINDVTIELPKAVNAIFDSILVLGHTILIAAYAAALLYLSPGMTIVTILVMGAAGLAMTVILRRTGVVSQEITAANRGFGKFFAERIRSTRLIRLSGESERELKRLTELSDACRERTVQLSRLQALTQVLVEPTAVFMAFGIILVGFTFFGMSAETLGIFVVVLARLMPVIRSALSDFQTVLGQWASLNAIVVRFNNTVEMREETTGRRVFSGLERSMRFEDIEFAYSDRSEPALSSVSIDIPYNQMTAIVGPSGAGKSTFIDLLPRLREPTSGSITVDDIPLEQFDRAYLRRGIAFVGQFAEVFDGTPRNHICYGVRDASPADIETALRLSGSDEFVARLENGLDSRLGENAHSLSGGQRQRLDIARALLKKAPILVLDEPTSQLDGESEMALQRALNAIRRETNTTIILVSHDLQLASEADYVYVLFQGKVIESGQPSTLAQQQSWFAHTLARGQSDGAVVQQTSAASA